ncbi:MAG: helix-turn-helix domain-containing protein [Gammaproteobacteria bacterium]|nr:helix-turn-helix domain-containing protein [Gammaproteobacteria bacterium]
MLFRTNNSIRPKKPVREDWHPADVVAAVRKAGFSLRALSREHGFAGGGLSNALRTQWPRAERIIADAIGVEPWDIWPSRYDDANQPLRAYPKGKNSSTARAARNAKPRQVA